MESYFSRINCFREVGISKDKQEETKNNFDDPSRFLAEQMAELRFREDCQVPKDVSNGDYIDIDESAFTNELVTLPDDRTISQLNLNKMIEQNTFLRCTICHS